MTIPDEWARVRQVFDGALALPADARAPYVVAVCGADQALREQVELLLDSHDRGLSFLETPPGPSTDAASHAMHLAGQRIGAYEVVSRLGAGGMGEVYRARDAKAGAGSRDQGVASAFHRATRNDLRASNARRASWPRSIIRTSAPSTGRRQVAGRRVVATRALVLELVEGDTLAERIALGTRDSGARGRGATDSECTHTNRDGAFQSPRPSGSPSRSPTRSRRPTTRESFIEI